MSSIEEMSPKEFHEKNLRGEQLNLLDLRNEDDFASWKIEGQAVRHLNAPYVAMLENEEEYLPKLDKNKHWITVCAKGGASKYMAEELREKGYQITNLAGGMAAYSELLYPSQVYQDDRLTLIQINRVGKGCLSYIVISAGEALILDAARFAEAYEEVLQNNGAKLRYVVDTHLHADHISGGTRLADRHESGYYIGSSDVTFGLAEDQKPTLNFQPLENFTSLPLGKVTVDVLAVQTPGHTPGSISLLVDNRFLLSGDTVFVNGLGRPDLGGKAREWAEDLYHTISVTLAPLHDDVLILPAHYADYTEMDTNGVISSRLGDLRQQSELLKIKDAGTFTDQVVAAAATETPPNYEEIVSINRGLVEVAADREAELEIGPNRCAVHHH